MSELRTRTTQHGRQMEILHTPMGVRDTYGREYAEKQEIIRAISRRMHLYGYQALQTPTFEFFDVFSKEIGTKPSRELYKFFDKEGNTLVLRPDFTPSVARVAARYFSDEKQPLRFCYEGSAFSNHTSDLQGRLRETCQIGAELMNDGSVYADAEMIALLIDALRASGLSDFQISIGNVEYFKGLCREASLTPEDESELRDAISGKNYFAAEDLLKSRGYGRDVRDSFRLFSNFLQDEDQLVELREQTGNSRSRDAVDRMIALHRILKQYGMQQYLSCDLSLLSRYNYYTGIIFKAYTYGTGEPVAAGGRYDGLLSYFGKDAPAVGSMIAVDPLLDALRRQGIHVPVPDAPEEIRYTPATYAQALEKASVMRAAGRAVVLLPAQEQAP